MTRTRIDRDHLPSLRSRPRIAPPALIQATAICLALGVFARPAAAQFKFDTSLSGVEQFDSNVFRLPSGATDPLAPDPPIGPDEPRDDRITNAVATAKLEYQLDQQRLYIFGDATRQWYQRYSMLDHDEFSGTGGLDWRAADWVDGSVSAHKDRRMVPESARLIPSLELDFVTGRSASGAVNFTISPQWRLETKAEWTKQDSPSLTALYFMNERTYTLNPKFTGLGQAAVGLQLQYVDGTITAPQVPLNTKPVLADAISGVYPIVTSRYRQYNEDVTVDYTVNSLSKLTAKLGSSQRRDPDNVQPPSNGFTGELQYKRTISPLTTMTFALQRKLQSYPSFNDFVVESGGYAQLEWKPTLKIYTSLLAQYLEDSFHSVDRTDQLALVDAGVNFQAFEHFSIKPGFHFEDRRSSGGVYSYVDRIYSVEAKLSF